MICTDCLQCKDCSSKAIGNLLNNVPLCKGCFKIRTNEKTCGICQKIDNELHYKIFQCDTCQNLVHAECNEKSEDDVFKLFNYMYNCTKFVCSICFPEIALKWRNKFNEVLKNGFHVIIRRIITNPSVHKIINYNTSSNNMCTCKNTLSSAEENAKMKSKQNCSNTVNISVHHMQNKLYLKECSVRINDCLKTTTKDKSGVLKIGKDKIKFKIPVHMTSSCQKHNSSYAMDFSNLKKCINLNKFLCVNDFYLQLKMILNPSNELIDIIINIIREIFPWFKQSISNKIERGRSNLNSVLKIFPHIPISTSKNTIINDNFVTTDTRTCVLCHKTGDCDKECEGRLIYAGLNEWIHVNCVFWSFKVYEDLDCSLQNVAETIRSSETVQCNYCKEKGATLKCFTENCNDMYHFKCAQSAKCTFFANKTIVCASHVINDDNTMYQTNFELDRPIYIKQTQKANIDLSKIQVLIGSLTITNLGTFCPQFSDIKETIIPTEFVCTRMFWSTLEPWKVIKYYISTTMLLNERNFTVDHSLSQKIIQEKLKEFAKWNNTEKQTLYSEVSTEKQSENYVDDNKIVSEVIDYLIETVCSREIEENATDILPPELKEAIFEDLPHDLLDGISVQDIFPKLMNYEDIISLDNNNIDIKSNLGKDLSSFCDKDSSQTKEKKDDLLAAANDLWFDQNQVSNDTMITENGRELKRSKSEILSGIKKISRIGTHQRSCSLTWSCKLDNNKTTTIRKRKLSSSKNFFMFLDGKNDKYNIQELKLPDNIIVSSLDKIREFKYYLDDNSDNAPEIEHEKENKCCMWRNRCQLRIPQTDGADDFSDSDCSENEIQIKCDSSKDKPVKCDRCQCTYRTEISYKKHLETCDYMSSSDNESEDNGATEVEVQNNNINNNQNSNINCNNNENNGVYIPTIPVKTSEIVADKFIQNKLTNGSELPKLVRNMKKIQSLPIVVEKVPTQTVKKIVRNNSIVNNNNNRGVVKPKTLVKRKLVGKKLVISNPSAPVVVLSNSVTGTINRVPDLDTTNSPISTVFYHHVPSTNMVTNFVDSFHPQTNNNFQYLGTLIPNDMSAPTTLLTSNIFVPQATESTNIITIPAPAIISNIVNTPQPASFPCNVLSNDPVMLGTSILTQPVYYGYETVVQNTVTSQQFSATELSGVLASNSSYSTTTTQVIHSSKLEPVIDMNNTNGYVLLNSPQVPLLAPAIQQQSLIANKPPTVALPAPITLSTPAPIIQQQSIVSNKLSHQNIIPASLPLIETQPHSQYTFQIVPIYDQPHVISTPIIKSPVIIPEPKVRVSSVEPSSSFSQISECLKSLATVNKFPVPSVPSKEFQLKPDISKPLLTNITVKNPTIENKLTSISPVQPLQNVTLQAPRPIYREVFPWFPKKASSPKELNKSDSEVTLETPNILNDITDIKTSEEIIEKKIDIKAKQSVFKLENTSLKLVFQKQSQDGIYKISNTGFLTKTKSKVDKTGNDIEINEKENKQLLNIIEKDAKRNSNNSKIENNNHHNMPKIIYHVRSQDGCKYSSTSLTDVWKQIFDAVQVARKAKKMSVLPENAYKVINGLQMLGLKSSGLKYVIEQLPGVGNCKNYKSMTIKRSNLGQDKKLDCKEYQRAIRCETYNHVRQSYDMFSWLTSDHRKPDCSRHDSNNHGNTRRSAVNLPIAMRFRQLKESSRNDVGVYQSKIHGRGLFCLRDMDEEEMIIEYTGEVIRSTITDKREKYYNSKGIGCYMFRVDDIFVIDATMTGNAARFINHSCDPNCYSRVIEVLGRKHIVILTKRKIKRGEELTYDYKFPIEVDKIPCTCGAKKCRKYLN